MKLFLFTVCFLSICFLLDLARSTDSTDKSRWTRSGMSLYTDYGTGLQYLKAGMFGGITPRIDKDGTHMRVK